MYSAYNATKAAVKPVVDACKRARDTDHEQRCRARSDDVRSLQAQLRRGRVAAGDRRCDSARASCSLSTSNACLFFCLPENGMVTGQALAVDGGTSDEARVESPKDASYTGRPES